MAETGLLSVQWERPADAATVLKALAKTTTDGSRCRIHIPDVLLAETVSKPWRRKEAIPTYERQRRCVMTAKSIVAQVLAVLLSASGKGQAASLSQPGLFAPVQTSCAQTPLCL